MKTKAPKIMTTTEPEYHYEIFEFPKTTMENGIRDASWVEMLSSYFGFFLTLFHLFILTRKDLRSDFIFRMVFVIAIFDFLHFSGTLTWNLLKWYLEEKEFHGRVGFWHKVLEIAVITSEKIVKSMCATVVLVLYLAKINEVIKKLSWEILVLFFGFWTGTCTYLSYQYYGIQAVADENYDPWVTTYTYELTISEEFRFFSSFHEWTTIIFFIYFTVSFIIQFIKFRRIIRTRHEDNESMALILLLSLSILAAEFLDLLVVLFSHFLLKPYCIMQEFFMQLQVIMRTLNTLLCVTHCLICMLTSSKYLKAVKHYLSRNKNRNVGSSDAPTISNRISNNPTTTNF